jgi:PBSX family phage terminase large subunit
MIPLRNETAFQERLMRLKNWKPRDPGKASSKLKVVPFKFKTFSHKQKQVLTWWIPGVSPHFNKNAIICDGSVRAGKTVVMSLSFVMWAMEMFSDENFGMAGKTIGALRRNVIGPLKRMLKARKYKVRDHRADNYLTITKNGRSNYFYLFGGKDESSQDLIQGITLAGMFFDEVALMPKSFVDQATARCSVKGAKFWFNCNPAGPYHWFKTEWLDQLERKNALHLHFTMRDNLSLDEDTIKRYESMYSGVFYKRYILGLWVLAEGVIYDMFNEDLHKISAYQLPDRFERYYVGVDYGHTNATVFLLIGELQGTLYVIKEYYHSGGAVSGGEEAQEMSKSPSEYAEDFIAFIKGYTISRILIDPAAKGFITELKKRGIRNIVGADNDVLPGISAVAVALTENILKVSSACVNTLREFGSYVWDTKAQERGEDKPLKKFDHCMDALRYVVYMLLGKNKQKTFGRVVGTTAADRIGALT